MSTALTPPLMLAGALLCVAGALKLRRPAPAARALSILGLRAAPTSVRAFAAIEVGLGGWIVIGAPRAAVAAVGCLYVGFAIVTLALARRRSACGCFGEDEAPASAVQSLLSAALAVVALLAATGGVHGLGWVLGQSPAHAATVLVGLAGAVYAAVLAYTELPRAWSAWSPR
jgi:hypothetical protein